MIALTVNGEERQVDAVPPEKGRERAAPVVTAHPHAEPAERPQRLRIAAAVGAPAQPSTLHPAHHLDEDQGPLVRLHAPHERHVPQGSRRRARQCDGRGDGRLEDVPAAGGPSHSGQMLRMEPP